MCYVSGQGKCMWEQDLDAHLKNEKVLKFIEISKNFRIFKCFKNCTNFYKLSKCKIVNLKCLNLVWKIFKNFKNIFEVLKCKLF